MAEAFDAIVVGSGFGGSAVACRLAEAGHRVLVLERGRRYPPGSFARRPHEMARNVWDPGEGLHGMFDLWSFRHAEAVVSSGLGGGSLIYANVMLRKDEKWFVRDGGPGEGYEHWPVTRSQLDPCYDRAEKMMGGVPYPYADGTPKTRMMRRAAEQLGLEWFLPPLAVAFAGPSQRPGDPIPGSADNLHKAVRSYCRLCGECDFGCNYGSKNTLDFTYLSAAQRAGAELWDRCEARELLPLREGFEVRYVRHHEANEGVRTSPQTETARCRVLVLAAGSLGTTYLLLRNRDAFPALGPALGTHACGNGDLLGFVLDSPDAPTPSYGPVITSTMRVPDRLDGGTGRGFYLQDGGYPGFVDWMVETGTVAGPISRAARFALVHAVHAMTGDPRSEIDAQIAALLGEGSLSAGVLPLLSMGRDVPDGRYRLRSGYLDLDWCDATSRRYYARMHATMAAVAERLGGEFTANPSRYLHRVVMVHPLGGVPMGEDDRRGVVDDHGEAFGHPGLFVADGSVMPGPVGPNPSLTIAALAERFAERAHDRLCEKGAPCAR